MDMLPMYYSTPNKSPSKTPLSTPNNTTNLNNNNYLMNTLNDLTSPVQVCAMNISLLSNVESVLNEINNKNNVNNFDMNNSVNFDDSINLDTVEKNMRHVNALQLGGDINNTNNDDMNTSVLDLNVSKVASLMSHDDDQDANTTTENFIDKDIIEDKKDLVLNCQQVSTTNYQHKNSNTNNDTSISCTSISHNSPSAPPKPNIHTHFQRIQDKINSLQNSLQFIQSNIQHTVQASRKRRIEYGLGKCVCMVGFWYYHWGDVDEEMGKCNPNINVLHSKDLIKSILESFMDSQETVLRKSHLCDENGCGMEDEPMNSEVKFQHFRNKVVHEVKDCIGSEPVVKYRNGEWVVRMRESVRVQ